MRVFFLPYICVFVSNCVHVYVWGIYFFMNVADVFKYVIEISVKNVINLVTITSNSVSKRRALVVTRESYNH